ncbi:MAG TPA: class I SAM-dependent methyltransferase, partial [Thermodesulfobacteriota bacterium]|nr:class I SAM-dependent methyltransferase [Thermodesulfobacteriota bacterium]
NVILTPRTLAHYASSPELWRDLLSFHHLLATDTYTDYLDAFYRESFKRFGHHWFYLDIVNVLFAASNMLHPQTYLEIGVRRGRSLCTVVRGWSKVDIVGCDLWMENYAGMENPGPAFVRSELEKHNHTGNITLLTGDSHQILPQYFQQNPHQRFDLVTVDGDHSETGAFADLCVVIPYLAPGGIIVFDDIAHPAHPYLLDVWRRTMRQFPFLVSYEYTDCGYGVAFALHRGTC